MNLLETRNKSLEQTIMANVYTQHCIAEISRIMMTMKSKGKFTFIFQFSSFQEKELNDYIIRYLKLKRYYVDVNMNKGQNGPRIQISW